MTPEEVLVAGLERQLGRLSPGHRHPVLLEQVVSDGFGGWRDGPHPVGWVERVSPGGVRIRLLASTEAGRTARVLLEEQLIDVTLSHSYPPVIRLGAQTSERGNEPPYLTD